MKQLNGTAIVIAGILGITVMISGTGCSKGGGQTAMTKPEMVERGKYLVMVAGCNDCHSPKMMTPQGPVPDTSRLLSGNPSDSKLPPIDTNLIAPGKWVLLNSDFTAFVGPWGVSYAANLTPDPETGTGTWNEDLFIKTLRTGKYVGKTGGRDIMPPMPWPIIGQLKDEDLKSIFAYLQTLKPIKNQVHDYVPPPMIASLNAPPAH